MYKTWKHTFYVHHCTNSRIPFTFCTSRDTVDWIGNGVDFFITHCTLQLAHGTLEVHSVPTINSVHDMQFSTFHKVRQLPCDLNMNQNILQLMVQNFKKLLPTCLNRSKNSNRLSNRYEPISDVDLIGNGEECTPSSSLERKSTWYDPNVLLNS